MLIYSIQSGITVITAAKWNDHVFDHSRFSLIKNGYNYGQAMHYTSIFIDIIDTK